MKVLPHPGGPHSRSPPRSDLPNCIRSSGLRIGVRNDRSSRFLTSVRPPTSARVMPARLIVPSSGSLSGSLSLQPSSSSSAVSGTAIAKASSSPDGWAAGGAAGSSAAAGGVAGTAGSSASARRWYAVPRASSPQSRAAVAATRSTPTSSGRAARTMVASAKASDDRPSSRRTPARWARTAWLSGSAAKDARRASITGSIATRGTLPDPTPAPARTGNAEVRSEPAGLKYRVPAMVRRRGHDDGRQ